MIAMSIRLLSQLCRFIAEVGEALRVTAHERLGEVLCVLKSILKKYPAVNSTDLLTSTGVLISKIKGGLFDLIYCTTQHSVLGRQLLQKRHFTVSLSTWHKLMIEWVASICPLFCYLDLMELSLVFIKISLLGLSGY